MVLATAGVIIGLVAAVLLLALIWAICEAEDEHLIGRQ